MSENKFHCLVVDTTAFIHNVPLQNHADYLITVPEVVNEIKNKRQLKRLCVLPYELVVDEPSPEAVQYVISFAKKTGDYLSLSSADIKVIALTYQLECELVGKKHLRTDPVIAKTIASKQKPVELIDKAPLAGFYIPPKREKLDEKAQMTRELIADKIEQESKEAKDDNDGQSEEDAQNETVGDETVEQLEDKFNALNVGLVSENEADQILVSIKDKNENKEDFNEEIESEEESENEEEEEEEEDDDDDSGWITPSNLIEMSNACTQGMVEETKARVACMSTDFAVQNVLKQINLNVAALDGRIIKQMRTYILRCYACFKTTSIMTKVFCPNCGHKTLKRVAVSMDENGQKVVHINLRRPLTAKGKNQSIPTFRGGKHSSNPILFEDQPIPKQFPSRVARTKTNALDEDYIAGFSPFALRDIDSKSAVLRAKHGSSNLKQWARNHAYRNQQRSAKK